MCVIEERLFAKGSKDDIAGNPRSWRRPFRPIPIICRLPFWESTPLPSLIFSLRHRQNRFWRERSQYPSLDKDQSEGPSWVRVLLASNSKFAPNRSSRWQASVITLAFPPFREPWALLSLLLPPMWEPWMFNSRRCSRTSNYSIRGPDFDDLTNLAALHSDSTLLSTQLTSSAVQLFWWRRIAPSNGNWFSKFLGFGFFLGWDKASSWFGLSCP